MFCHEEINTFTCSRQDYFEEGIDSTCASALVQIVYFSKDRGGILTKPFQWDVNESLVVRFTDKSPLLAWAGSGFQTFSILSHFMKTKQGRGGVFPGHTALQGFWVGACNPESCFKTQSASSLTTTLVTPESNLYLFRAHHSRLILMPYWSRKPSHPGLGLRTGIFML